MSPSFSLEPWKNLTSRQKSTNSCIVRFDREDLLKELCSKNFDKFRVWAFPGHLFWTSDECDEGSLISFSILALNETACEFSHLDIKQGDNGSIVDIADFSRSGESRFWFTFETGLIQEWAYSSYHSCGAEPEGSPHRGWVLLSENQFLRSTENPVRVEAAGVVDNALVWLQSEDPGDLVSRVTSLWRLSLPTGRGDGDDDGEITFGSPVCILSKLPPCRFKTFSDVVVAWTIDCANGGGDFAFILNPSSAVLRLIHIGVQGPPEEEDLEAAKFDDWVRVRIIDVVRRENGRDSNANESLRVARGRVSPLDFSFDARSKAILMIQKNGTVFRRGCGTKKGQPGTRWVSGGWKKIAQLWLEDGNDGNVKGETSGSLALASFKCGLFLASIRDEADVDVYAIDVDDDYSLPTTSLINRDADGHSDHEFPRRRRRFCLGRMPFPIILESGAGLFRVAVASTQKPYDVARKGFGRILTDVDRLIRDESAVGKAQLMDDIAELRSKARPSAFLRSVKPDLKILAETLGSFADWMARCSTDERNDDEVPAHCLPMSDRLLKEFCGELSEGRMDDDSLQYLLHRLEFLSHAEADRVISSLTALLYSGGANRDDAEVESTLKNVFFASKSSTTAFSSPVTPSSAPQTPEPLHSSLFQLMASLFLVHRSADFQSMLKDFFFRFCGEDANPDWFKAVRSLEQLRGRLEGEGQFKAVRLLQLSLKEMTSQQVKIDGADETVGSLESMKSLMKDAEWKACVALLTAVQADPSTDDVAYKALFDIFLDGLARRAGSEELPLANDVMRLMPDNYDMERFLAFISSIDDRSCSSQIICRNPGCNHVTVQNLRF